MNNFITCVELDKLYLEHIYVGVNQINTNYENWGKDLIIFYLEKMDERILVKLNLYLILK